MENFQQLVRSAVAPDLEEIKASLAKLIAAQETKPISTPIGEDEYLTKRQAAKLVNRSPSTIDNARRAGKLTPYRIGDRNGSIRFKRNEVIDWIEGKK